MVLVLLIFFRVPSRSAPNAGPASTSMVSDRVAHRLIGRSLLGYRVCGQPCWRGEPLGDDATMIHPLPTSSWIVSGGTCAARRFGNTVPHGEGSAGRPGRRRSRGGDHPSREDLLSARRPHQA